MVDASALLPLSSPLRWGPYPTYPPPLPLPAKTTGGLHAPGARSRGEERGRAVHVRAPTLPASTTTGGRKQCHRKGRTLGDAPLSRIRPAPGPGPVRRAGSRPHWWASAQWVPRRLVTHDGGGLWRAFREVGVLRATDSTPLTPAAPLGGVPPAQRHPLTHAQGRRRKLAVACGVPPYPGSEANVTRSASRLYPHPRASGSPPSALHPFFYPPTTTPRINERDGRGVPPPHPPTSEFTYPMLYCSCRPAVSQGSTIPHAGLTLSLQWKGRSSMALMKAGFGMQASGKVGGIVISRGRGGMQLKNWAMPVNPNTPQQQEVRNRLASLSNRYTTVLTDVQRQGWKNWGSGVTFKNRLGDTITLPAIAVYNAANSYRVTGGAGVLDDAPTVNALAELTPPTILADAVTGITISFDNGDGWATVLNGNLLIYISKTFNPGVEFYGESYRYLSNVSGSSPAPSSPAILSPINYPFNGTLPAGQQVECRFVAILPDGRYSSPTFARATITP